MLYRIQYVENSAYDKMYRLQYKEYNVNNMCIKYFACT